MVSDQLDSTRELQRDSQRRCRQRRPHSIRSATWRGRDIPREQTEREFRIELGRGPAISAVSTIALQ